MATHPIVQPWLLSEQGMELLFAVWSRGELFPAALQRARTERGDEPFGNPAEARRVGAAAIIPVYGPMFRHAGMMTELSGATSYQRIGRDLQAAVADPAVGRIILDIDSPGGEVSGCGELATQIRAACKSKPVLAYVSGQAASGAYWLASAASEIIADPSAVIGGLGCRIALTDSAKAQELAGVKRVEIISSQTPAKRGSPVDGEVQGRAQRMADDIADVFLGAVAGFRGVGQEKVLKDFGAGEQLIASRALAAGMIDRLGNLDAVLEDGGESDDMDQKQGASQQPAPTTALEPGLKALLGTDDPTAAMAEVAALKADRARLKELEAQRPERRQAALQQARGRNLAPIQLAQLEQMAGDQQIPVEVVERCASTWLPPVQRLEAAGAAPASGGDPHPAAKAEVTLNDADRAAFAKCGITDEATMLAAKKSMKEVG